MDEKERYRVALAGMQQGSVRLQSLRQRCLAIEPWLSSGESLQIRFEDIVGHRGMDPTKRSVRRCMCFFAFLDIPTGGIDRVARELFGPGRSTFRQGQVNTWHDEMPKEVARLAETELADLRAKWGYT